MSNIINFTNIGVSIVGQGAIYANTASYSFSVPIEGVRSLGNRNAIADIPNGPIEGTLNIEYIVTSNDPGVSIFTSITNNPGGYQGSSVSIGGRTFANAYLTSHSLTAEANSIVNGSLSFTVFGEGGDNMISSNPGTVNNIPIGHGTASTAITNAISFDYNASIEWEPIYILGNANSQGVTFRSAQQTIDIRGFNAGRAIQRCPSDETVNVSIGAVCGGSSLVNLTIPNAKLTSSESTVSAGGFVEGSYQLIKSY
jgi:hypothetical protein